MQWRGFFAIAGLLLCCGTIAGRAAPDSSGGQMALDWLAYADSGNAETSWTAAGSMFHNHGTKESWSQALSALRSEFGELKSRTKASEEAKTNFPGAPDGQYLVETFNSTFQNKGSAVETVILAQEKDGWKVEGYFIR